MDINVAQLLKENTGASREYELSSEINIDDKTALVSGRLQLIRINLGVLVKGSLKAAMPLNCSRCLEEYRHAPEFNFAEEYRQTVDVETGVAIASAAAAEFTINDHHILDLHEGIRQNILLTVPMKPLCNTSCRGICPVCGGNRNRRNCDCDNPQVDQRWEPLLKLRLNHKGKEE
jgi:DUF177 domain-containing protein